MACSWDSTTQRRSAERRRSPSATPAVLTIAAVRREVAAQHGQTAFGVPPDGRCRGWQPLTRSTIEGLEQRGARPRFGWRRMRPGAARIHLLGFLGAGAAHDVPRRPACLPATVVVDGMHVAVQQAGAVELAEDAGDAAGAVHMRKSPSSPESATPCRCTARVWEIRSMSSSVKSTSAWTAPWRGCAARCWWNRPWPRPWLMAFSKAALVAMERGSTESSSSS